MSLTRGEHVFDIDGVRQAYEVAGTGPVCVVHSGGPGVNSDYLRMPHLEKHLTMVYLDPVGTRRSGLLPSGDYSVERYAEFSRRVIAHLGVDRPFFLGHSHGGFVGLQLALDNPGLLGGLVLYSSAPVFNDDLVEEAGRQMDAFVARWPDRPEAAEAGRVYWQEATADSPLVTDHESFLAYLMGILPAYFADYRRIVTELGPISLDVTYDPARQPNAWDVRGKLGAMQIPTLIVSGAYDWICSRRWAGEMNAELPNAHVLELNDSGHFGYFEQRDYFVRGILDFIEPRS